MSWIYLTVAYFKEGKGPRAWDDFLNKHGAEGWQLVWTQEMSGRRNCTFMKPKGDDPRKGETWE